MANSDNQQNAADMMSRNRRSSFTSSTLSSIFPRSNSVSGGTPVFPGSIASAALNEQNLRRRLSISTASALGLSGTSPISAGGPSSAGGGGSGGGPSSAGLRRASMSTNSSASDTAADESAIEEDDVAPSEPRGSPSTPYARRTSFGAQAIRSFRGGSVGNGRQRSSPGPGQVSATTRQKQQQQQQQQQPQLYLRSISPTSSPSPSSASSPFSPPAAASPHSPSSPMHASSASFSFSARPKNSLAAALHSPRTASDKFHLPAARADQGYNWPEQFRSRAESSVASGSRASFSFVSGLGNSPPRSGGFSSISGFGSGGAGAGAGAGGGVGAVRHDRSKSVSDAAMLTPPMPTPIMPTPTMPTPTMPAAQPPAAAPRPRQQPRQKPDHFQERILKGDFYMD